MKQLIFSLFIFAAFTAQAQKPTTLKPQQTPQDSAVKVYFWVDGKGVKNLTCDRIEERGNQFALITETGANRSEFYISKTAYHGKKTIRK